MVLEEEVGLPEDINCVNDIERCPEYAVTIQLIVDSSELIGHSKTVHYHHPEPEN